MPELNLENGWIKCHRKVLDWRWFKKPNYFHLFSYLILRAGYKQTHVANLTLEKGQFITSLDKIKKDTGLSIQTIRTILKNLELTSEIHQKSTNKFTVITICNYETYQQDENTNQQSTNKQLTTNKNIKNKEEEFNTIISTSSNLVSFNEILEKFVAETKLSEAEIKSVAENYFKIRSSRAWMDKFGNNIQDIDLDIKIWCKNQYKKKGIENANTGEPQKSGGGLPQRTSTAGYGKPRTNGTAYNRNGTGAKFQANDIERKGHKQPQNLL